MREIGHRMKELREKANLLQTDMAKLFETNRTTIGKMESGATAPSVKILVQYADYFDVSMDYLCCRTDQPQGRLYECKPVAKDNNGDMGRFIEMCFDPASPYRDKLKEALLKVMEDATK